MSPSCRAWCVAFPQRFSSRKDYSSHVELLHEELAVLGDKYVACAKCQVRRSSTFEGGRGRGSCSQGLRHIPWTHQPRHIQACEVRGSAG